MKVLNYGSLNVDYVYSVDHIIVGGETQHSSKLEVFSGGKGLNQSIALAKAGVPVYHAGIVGTDGDILLEACKEAGVNTKYIRRLPVKGGHTMIQVDKNAQNCIILYGGTNQMQTKEFVRSIHRGSAKSLISALFRDEDFTKEDIEELKRFIEEKGDE